MAEMHAAALEITVTAENWSGTVGVRSGIDGRVVNTGAKLYSKFNNQHLEPVEAEVLGDDAVLLLVRTSQSQLAVAQAARTRIFRDDKMIDVPRRSVLEPAYAGQCFTVPIAAGEPLQFEKLAAIVHCIISYDLDHAGLWINLEFGDVTAIGECLRRLRCSGGVERLALAPFGH